jgi:hypothetical protein
MAAARRTGLEGAVDHFGDALVIEAARPSGAQLVVQAFDAALEVAFAPLADRGMGQSHALGDGVVGFAIGAGEHDLDPAHQRMRQRACVGDALQLAALVHRQAQRSLRSSLGH